MSVLFTRSMSRIPPLESLMSSMGFFSERRRAFMDADGRVIDWKGSTPCSM